MTTNRRYKLAVHTVDGVFLALLENAKNVVVGEEYNALPTLTFRLRRDDPKVDYCSYGNEVWLYIDGSFYDCYRMDHFIDSHSSRELMLNVEAVQIGDRLNEDIVQDYSATTTIEAHATALLAKQKTGYQVTLGGIDSALNLTREFEADGVTIWKALRELRDTVGGILYVECDTTTPTTRKLWLKETIGEDKGQQIRYHKNLLGITRDVDYRTGVYASKLYPYGSGIQLDTTPLTETPVKSDDATYGYLTLPITYECYKGWTAAGAACPSGMILYHSTSGDYATPSSASQSGTGTSWYVPNYSYDEDTGTYAYSAGTAYGSWTKYLEFPFVGSFVGAIKLIAKEEYLSGYFNPYVEIDVYDGSSWTNVKTGYISYTTWVEVTFTPQSITKIRVRFQSNADPSWSTQLRLYEIQIKDKNIISDWKQGESNNVIRTPLATYDAGADYTLIYTHSAYLYNTAAPKEISVRKDYDTSDFYTLLGLASTDFEELSEPYTTYKISVADLSQRSSFEFIKLGSKITVLDDDLSIIIQTRVVRLTRRLDTNGIEVEISNAIKTLIDTIKALL